MQSEYKAGQRQELDLHVGQGPGCRTDKVKHELTHGQSKGDSQSDY